MKTDDNIYVIISSNGSLLLHVAVLAKQLLLLCFNNNSNINAESNINKNENSKTFCSQQAPKLKENETKQKQRPDLTSCENVFAFECMEIHLCICAFIFIFCYSSVTVIEHHWVKTNGRGRLLTYGQIQSLYRMGNPDLICSGSSCRVCPEGLPGYVWLLSLSGFLVYCEYIF